MASHGYFGNSTLDQGKNQMLRLKQFRVTNFRSVVDSGWIEADQVTALIGTNEAGKTNLLLPLWKLNPAKEGAINPISDYPRKLYNEFRAMKRKPVFIEADFIIDATLAKKLSEITGAPADKLTLARVTRDFEGKHTVAFPEAGPAREVDRDATVALVEGALTAVSGIEPVEGEGATKAAIVGALTTALACLRDGDGDVDRTELDELVEAIDEHRPAEPAAHSSVVPRTDRLLDALKKHQKDLGKPHPQANAAARTAVIEALPKFVYYSNYGNLDSEIYLPHVIQNLQRKDLGSKEEAKARTLKVLFEFVKLKPQEIQELGKEVLANPASPTPQEIEKGAEKRKERDILLQSAGTALTGKFREWWKQGEYRFRFQADGDHFRIWVSDDRRPEDVELEGRSAGLQWFLSFYLVFLVESGDAHDGCVLLLDEPGHSLHALAQRDLSLFFDSLSSDNQLLYTTHSPFLVDPDQLDRVRAVYVDKDGATAVSKDLRASNKASSEGKSVYAVHAALGLSVSDVMLLGCRPVIVEGTSDQHYLSGIKTFLIGEGAIRPKRELMFLPGGGVKGIAATVPIVIGRDEALPWIVLDSDKSGHDLARKLDDGLYLSARDRVLRVGNFMLGDGAEIEDLVPLELFADVVTRILRGPHDDFVDVAQKGKPVVPQVEAFAKANGLTLHPGWKVDVAAEVKRRLLKGAAVPSEYLAAWKKLFEHLAS